MRTEMPSKTARKVALNIVTLGSKRGMDAVLPSGIVETTATLLVKSGAVGRRAVHFSRSRTAVCIYLAFDWMMPGQFEAFAHRKAFCERQTREGIDAGASQVLVLGAGYDTMGWRLAPEFPGANFFEIDHPATARHKALGIESMGCRDNLFLLPEDLSKKTLMDVLREQGKWKMGAPSVIVAEGLLMYLPADAVSALFDECAEIGGPGSRIAFTYVGTRADGRPDAGPWTWLVLLILRASREPWLWSVPPDELGPFLQKHGWTVAPGSALSSDRHGVEFFGVAVR